MKWIHSDKELDEFFEHANSIYPSIKFTHEVSKTEISFIDTTTTVKEGNMTTDLYSKPTDKHQYLSPSSCHYMHCFKSIPFSQAIGIKRICSTVETTKQRLGVYAIIWRDGDIMTKLLRVGFQMPVKLTEITSWKTKKKRSTNGFPLFSLTIPFWKKMQASSIITGKKWKRWNAGQVVTWTTHCSVPTTKIMKDTLVRAAVSRPSSTVGQSKPCCDKRCKCCLQLQHAQAFHNKTTGKEYDIFYNV